MAANASAAIARFAARRCAITAAQRQVAFRALLDTFAVAAAAQDENTVALARGYVAEVVGHGRARAWVTGERVPAESAAWLNAIAAHVLDYDDVLTPMRAHVSAILVPALLALHDRTPASSPGFAAAYVAGFEVMAKFARAMALDHYSKGWHSTSALGVLGVTVACCVLLDAEEAAIVDALGLAVAQAAGTRENFGAMAKSFQAGVCAAAAVRAALLANDGFTSSPSAIDGRYGYMHLYANDEDLHATLATLGEVPLEIDAMGIDQKKYPCCYGVHRAIDATLALCREHSLGYDDPASIEVLTSARGREALIAHLPRDPMQAKFSMEYALASAIVDRQVSMATFTEASFERDDVRALMRKVTLEESAGAVLPRWSEVTIVTRDGARRSKRVEVAHGDAPDPMTDVELAAKARDCFAAAGYGGEGVIARVLDTGLTDEARVAACLVSLDRVKQ